MLRSSSQSNSMAKQARDGEFWLPSDILCNGLFPGGEADGGEGKAGFDSSYLFCLESNLSSPVESVTETEGSDEEEDYVAGLTQQMARYFLQDDEKDSPVAAAAAAEEGTKGMARSPQSTLSAWSAVSNIGSPNGPSVVSSPPTSSPMEQRSKHENSTNNPLCEAAGQVMRLQLQGLSPLESPYDRGIIGAPTKNSRPMATGPKNDSHDYYAPNHALTSEQIRAAHFYHLRRRQMLNHQLSAVWGRQSKARQGSGGYVENRCVRPSDLSLSAWPPLIKTPPAQQPQPPSLHASGMRSVFLSTGDRKESAGTGVFLPRTACSKPEPKKKTGCSTVLVPDRVVQALNLNLEELATQPRFPGGFVLSHDALIGRSSAAQSYQKKNHHKIGSQPPTTNTIAASTAPELGLPQEWIY